MNTATTDQVSGGMGGILAAMRRGARVSQRELASSAGIDATTLSRIETGVRPADRVMYARLVAALAEAIDLKHGAAGDPAA